MINILFCVLTNYWALPAWQMYYNWLRILRGLRWQMLVMASHKTLQRHAPGHRRHQGIMSRKQWSPEIDVTPNSKMLCRDLDDWRNAENKESRDLKCLNLLSIIGDKLDRIWRKLFRQNNSLSLYHYAVFDLGEMMTKYIPAM